MIVNINYGNKVTVLPNLSEETLKAATATDLKVLLAVAPFSGQDADLKALSEKLGIELREFVTSLGFWQKSGALTASDKADATVEEKPIEENKEEESGKAKKKILRKSDEIPRYTTDELSVILESRSETSHLIDECQQVFGKMFNPHEINILLGLVDYLDLGWDYVLDLLEFCAKQGKHSMNYVERTAFSFVESGIDNRDALKIKIAELEALKTNENFVRKLFGMKSRALTAKEKKCIAQWFGKFGYGEEEVSRAYELTVSATNDPSVPYTNAILERWFGEGLKNIEEIEKAITERAAARESEHSEGSFDTDDFFEAALKRSYGQK